MVASRQVLSCVVAAGGAVLRALEESVDRCRQPAGERCGNGRGLGRVGAREKRAAGGKVENRVTGVGCEWCTAWSRKVCKFCGT